MSEPHAPSSPHHHHRRDAVEDVPTVVVTTEHFRRLTDQVATSLNRPDLRIVETRHPIGGVDPDEIRRRANGVVDEVLTLLTVTTGGNP